MSTGKVFKYSSREYKTLDPRYFKYTDVPAPLVCRKWMLNLKGQKMKDSQVHRVAEIRKRGRPKKIKVVEDATKEKDILLNDAIFCEQTECSNDDNYDEELLQEETEPCVVLEQKDVKIVSVDKEAKPNLPDGGESFIEEPKTKISKKKGGINVNAVVEDTRVVYPCPTCGKTFASASSMKYHHRIHSGELQCCEYCGRGFTTKYLLKCHARVHTGELFTCSSCGKGFTTAELLKVHRRGHTGEKPFACDQCPRRFLSSSNLTQHKDTHSRDKKYLCPYCGASFYQKRCLNGHLVIHKEKMHVCAVCGTQWARKSDLVEHLRRHTGKKPYECKTCNKRFTQHGSLNRHMLGHQGAVPVACSYCDQLFNNGLLLKRHLKEEHDDAEKINWQR